MSAAPPPTQRGIGLIDSLVAIVVVSVGLLALLSLHLGLSRSAESLRQRGEATRLAQQWLEAERSAAPQPAPAPPTSTAAYAVERRSAGAQRSLAVSWQDRGGNAQRVELGSHLRTPDTTATAMLAFAAPPQPLTPGLRAPAIPRTAASRGAGRSTWSAETSAFEYRIADGTGIVDARCRKDSPTQCEELVGYLLSGFIRYGAGVEAASLALQPDAPLQVLPTDRAELPARLECATQSSSPAGERYLSYTCVVLPVDHDRRPDTPPRWSGTLALNPAGWNLADYQVDLLGHATQHVTGSLDQQNFRITRAGTIREP